jgi:hypothetical protein
MVWEFEMGMKKSQQARVIHSPSLPPPIVLGMTCCDEKRESPVWTFPIEKLKVC